MRIHQLACSNLLGRGAALRALALATAMLMTLPVVAQFGGGGGGGGLGGGGGGLGGGGGGLGGGGGGLGGGGGGSAQSNFGGVAVDADGVLQRTTNDPTGELARQRVAEALSRLDGDLGKPSKLRKVSLTKLEEAVGARMADGQAPTDEMLRLAGLTRIEYVFCYPETDEIILAGPAEPWAEAPSGRYLGIESGQPVVELQDLLAALRAFSPNTPQDDPLIYCSIDPTAEGLSRMQKFLAGFGRSATPNDTRFIVNQLQEKLGMQVVSVGGVPADTHFAQVLVEADYRMKLIGIGLEQPPIRLKSYVDRANPAMVSRNAMQRWFFVPDYERLKVTDDGLAVELVGEGVKLIGEDELVSRDGGRRQVGSTNRASQAFVKAFTKGYSQLADRSPVYAQLRNCIDLAVAAAAIRSYDFYGKTDWSMELFGEEATYPIRTYNAPQQVATAVNSIWKGSTLMTPIGGGVQIRPSESLDPVNLKSDESGELAETRQRLIDSAAAGRWWWD